jgi:hypothetical protein
MGTPAVAGWIAHVVFWALLIGGVAIGELGRKAIATFVILWVAGFCGLPYLPYGDAFFVPFVAVLDIALVLTIFKGDVRMT